ncbi:MAG TPA: phytanoyl-CoA dioxygenase family protein [Acidobacteriaceae bacterium]|jgi:ectoine hydroxylase-related dioxygenase (phytanoyl-CoA dioxygenase family)|nr:phytanoyl-CoA dioxygenase family protein [Acidobacteriaceae bacterium]
MKSFHAIHASDLDPRILHKAIEADGYLLVREVLPRDDVRRLLRRVSAMLADAGWLEPGQDPEQRIAVATAACGDPNPEFKRVYQQVFNLEAFHALPHHPALVRVMQMLTGEQLLIHPKPIGRLIFPRCERLTVRAHQDYRFMGGDPECFTAWIPLHDCPVNVGPLRIVEGSHRFGILKHDDENLHVPEIRPDAAVGGEWVGGRVDAGDVLIFHSLTLHAASANRSRRMRISLDCRFQDYRRGLNPANLAFGGESGKSWERTYSGWQSNDLKYYWKALPLELRPSRPEIEQLVRSAASPEARARYARILAQI